MGVSVLYRNTKPKENVFVCSSLFLFVSLFVEIFGVDIKAGICR